MAAYTTIDDPSAHFKVQLYTGNGTDDTTITFDDTDTNMAPDFSWIKNRNTETKSHQWVDTVRGYNKYLFSDTTQAEQTQTDRLKAWTSDGFTLGDHATVNQNTIKYASWHWKAGGGTVTNTAGDKDSTVSVSTTAGISIVMWSNDTSDAISIGHSLGAIPDAVIVKERGDAVNWHGRFKGFAANDYISLNNNEAKGASTAVFATLPTTTLFYTGTAAYHINADLIAWCFTSIQGFSKIGSYTGNGNADGTFVYTGFRPAFIMLKNTAAAEDWWLMDNKREGFNSAESNRGNFALQPNANYAENTNHQADILSNGFKFRATSAEVNSSGVNYLYMAFAEQPFVNSNGVPCTAR
tara:strand:+ start:163 stop:1221 length:1059 start_codon:yes stop_codon:yes gene_type:complete